jgi:hypothetical protein
MSCLNVPPRGYKSLRNEGDPKRIYVSKLALRVGAARHQVLSSIHIVTKMKCNHFGAT